MSNPISTDEARARLLAAAVPVNEHETIAADAGLDRRCDVHEVRG